MSKEPKFKVLPMMRKDWVIPVVYERKAKINPEWEKLGPERNAFPREPFKAIKVGPVPKGGFLNQYGPGPHPKRPKNPKPNPDYGPVAKVYGVNDPSPGMIMLSPKLKRRPRRNRKAR